MFEDIIKKLLQMKEEVAQERAAFEVQLKAKEDKIEELLSVIGYVPAQLSEEANVVVNPVEDAANSTSQPLIDVCKIAAIL